MRKRSPNNAYDWPWSTSDQPPNAHLPVAKYPLRANTFGRGDQVLEIALARV